MQEPEAAADQILDSLTRQGYYHVREQNPVEWCEAVSAALGTILLRYDVVVDAERNAAQQRARTFNKNRPSVYQPDSLGMHNDNSNWNILGWYCLQQDADGVSSLLIDASDVAGYFSPAELDELCSTLVVLPTRDASGKQIGPHIPILSKVEGAYFVYWVPWLKLDNYTARQAAVVERFEAYIRHKENHDLIELRMRPGECLFIHNNRMLHARRALDERSPRHLIRFSIRSPRIAGRTDA